jgi:hypothetical protein
MTDADTTQDATPPAPFAPPSTPVSPAAGNGKRGVPRRNQNRTLHAIFGLGLPRGTSHIAERLNRLRRDLAALVEERHGEVSLYHAAVIDAAVKWERLGQLSGRWLRKEGDKLAPTEKLTFAKEIARAAVERNRSIAALGLDSAPAPDNPFAEFDRQREREQRAAIEAAMIGDKPALSSVASVLPAPSDEYARPHPGAVPADDAPACEFGGHTR